MWIIDGIQCLKPADVRKFCREYTTRKFQQDIRLVNGARTLPISQLVDLIKRCGHDVVYE